jgi:hypothetical protein
MENSYWRVFILSGAWMLGIGVQAQNEGVQYVNEVMTQEDAASENWEETYERLSELEQQPLDINMATREQLEELPFLSDQQIEELQEYLYRYGPMKSVGELMMIRSLGYEQRRLLSYFICFGEEKEKGFPKISEMARYGKHELIGMARIPFYTRKGDGEKYLGPPYRHWLRYQFTHGESLKIGLVGAQDAGEPFFAHQNQWGYDYYSFYLQLRHLGRLESLCLGNYRVSMGMGLVMNSEFSMGKVAVLQNMGRTTQTLRAHSSRSNNSLLGGAATISLNRGMKLSVFASYRPMDATLNKDSTIATILSTSYHRTETEMAKKNNMYALKTGGMLGFRRHGFHADVNTLYVRLDKELRPNASILYRQHYPQGRAFMNTSLDYGYVNHRWALNGETALDKDGHLATLNSVSLRVSDVLSITALLRFYSYRYASLDAQSYSDGGKVQNESGIYLGLSWQPSARWRVSAYTDYAYFPWAKYQVSQSSSSWDHLLQATYQHRAWTFAARYRLRIKESDGADGTSLQRQPVHRVRLSADYSGDSGFGCRTQLDGGYGTYGDKEWGAMVSESLAYTHRWLRLNAGLGYFHTDGYDNRVYLYEHGPLYAYSMTAFYGEGIRYWLMVRAGIGQHLSLTAKVGVTDYFDRTSIGSGYQQVDASSLTDLDLQLRWKF